MSRRSAEAQAKRSRNPYQRRIDRYDRISEALSSDVSNLYGCILDDDNPLLQLTFTRREEGDFLVIVKRSGEFPLEEVVFARGEDIVECLMEANTAVNKGKWKEQMPYKPPTPDKTAKDD